jgi:tetratricopeptide (TPR) repeat protein
MLYKTIIQGKLEFGTEKTYDKVLKMFLSRAENYHKNDILFEPEDIFIKEELCLKVPRYVNQVYEKTYRNTATLFAYCAQFAVSGSLNAWLIDSGNILHHENMEPESDKIAVQQYLKGKSLVRAKGKQEEAIEALTAAIEKYDRHAQAYERRAKVNFIMKKYHDAKRDYTKSISFDDAYPYAYYGRAKVYLIEKDYKSAIADFDKCLKSSVALQEIYWKARRIKSQCHVQLKEYDLAAFDLKLFCNRAFPKGSTLDSWKEWAYYHYGIVLLELEQYTEALEAFENAIIFDNEKNNISDAEKLRYRGIAKQKAGKNGYISDFKEAADLGDKPSAAILKGIA